jgi:hypothetical protein
VSPLGGRRLPGLLPIPLPIPLPGLLPIPLPGLLPIPLPGLLPGEAVAPPPPSPPLLVDTRRSADGGDDAWIAPPGNAPPLGRARARRTDADPARDWGAGAAVSRPRASAKGETRVVAEADRASRDPRGPDWVVLLNVANRSIK